MKKIHFVYHRPAALVMSLVLLATPALARRQSATPDFQTFFTPQLRTQLAGNANTLISGLPEVNTILDEYLRLIEQLRQKTTITPAELTAARNKASTLKNKLDANKRALAAWVDTLKRAGKFALELDNVIAARLQQRCPACATTLSAEGGARALLNELLSELGNLPTGVDRLLISIQGKVVSADRSAPPGGFLVERETIAGVGRPAFSLVPVAYAPNPAPAAPAFGRIFKCLVRATVLIAKAINGTDTPEDHNRFDDAC